MRFRLVVDGESRDVEILRRPRGVIVRIDGAEYRTSVRRSDDRIAVRIAERTHDVRFEAGAVVIGEGRHAIAISEIEEDQAAKAADVPSRGEARLEVRAPMPGRVVRVSVQTGTRVRRGRTLIVLEAMKMQNEISAPRDGVVRELFVREGESIAADRVVAVLEGR